MAFCICYFQCIIKTIKQHLRRLLSEGHYYWGVTKLSLGFTDNHGILSLHVLSELYGIHDIKHILLCFINFTSYNGLARR